MRIGRTATFSFNENTSEASIVTPPAASPFEA